MKSEVLTERKGERERVDERWTNKLFMCTHNDDKRSRRQFERKTQAQKFKSSPYSFNCFCTITYYLFKINDRGKWRIWRDGDTIHPCELEQNVNKNTNQTCYNSI